MGGSDIDPGSCAWTAIRKICGNPLDQLGEPEVDQLRALPARRVRSQQEDVLGLEVSVNDALGMHGDQRLTDLAKNRDRLSRRQAAPLAQNVAEVTPLQILHHVVVPAVGQLSEREDIDQSGVTNVIDRARLQHEAADRVLVVRQPAGQHLDGHLLANDRMDGAVDGPHPALSDAVQDLVLAHQRPWTELRGHLAIEGIEGRRKRRFRTGIDWRRERGSGADDSPGVGAAWAVEVGLHTVGRLATVGTQIGRHRFGQVYRENVPRVRFRTHARTRVRWIATDGYALPKIRDALVPPKPKLLVSA